MAAKRLVQAQAAGTAQDERAEVPAPGTRRRVRPRCGGTGVPALPTTNRGGTVCTRNTRSEGNAAGADVSRWPQEHYDDPSKGGQTGYGSYAGSRSSWNRSRSSPEPASWR